MSEHVGFLGMRRSGCSFFPVSAGGAKAGVGLPDRLTLLAFVGVVAIAGANFVAVRFANEDVAPFFGAGLRFSIAWLLLLVAAIVVRVPTPSREELVGTVLYGILAFGGSMALGYWALLRLPAGIAGVIIAAVPVLTLLLARVHGLEPFRWRGLLGGLLTVGGIWVLLAGSGSAPVPIGSALAMVGAAFCFAEAGIVIKKFPPCHPMASNGLAMSIGAALLLVLSQVFGESWSLPTREGVWLVLAYIVLVGSVALFGMYLFVLKGWTASGASYQFVLMPFVAALLGAWLLGETINGGFVIGGLIVLTGVYVGALSSGSVPVPATPEQEAQAQRCSTT